MTYIPNDIGNPNPADDKTTLTTGAGMFIQPTDQIATLWDSPGLDKVILAVTVLFFIKNIY